MARSSIFGNMFSAAGASLFLSFLPMLPSQILLNNLRYDVGQLAIPGDEAHAEILARPAFSPLAHRLGVARLPLAFFFILLGMIAAYLVLIEVAKARFYRAERHPHRVRPTHEQRNERHQRRRLARFMHHEGPRLPIVTGTLNEDQ